MSMLKRAFGLAVLGLVACSSGGDDGGGGSGGSNGSGGPGPGGDEATDGDPRQGGIGRACEVDSDCESGLRCHVDLEDYIGHGQCTATCFASDDCEAIAELSICIGANICTASCLTDDDCPDKTRCSDNNWCERTGVGSGNPYCTGFALPCSSLSGFECGSALGCRSDGDCSGVSRSCFSYSSSFSCNSQDGCFWSSFDDDCSGSSRSCFSMSSEFSCTGQDGCSWSDRCTGTPFVTDCEEESVALCDFTPGCRVVFP